MTAPTVNCRVNPTLGDQPLIKISHLEQ